MIQYTIRDYGVMPDNERYFVGFGLENTANNKEGYVQAYVAIAGNTDKSESQICNLAFSGAYAEITGVSGKLEASATVVGSEFLPPDM
tara:strand:- start:1179 stop:1442 length:264 start_codon:yes stop_codon:yes gene_type:complete